MTRPTSFRQSIINGIYNVTHATSTFFKFTAVKTVLALSMGPGLYMLGRGFAEWAANLWGITNTEEREFFIESVATMSSAPFIALAYKLFAQSQTNPTQAAILTAVMQAVKASSPNQEDDLEANISAKQGTPTHKLDEIPAVAATVTSNDHATLLVVTEDNKTLDLTWPKLLEGLLVSCAAALASSSLIFINHLAFNQIAALRKNPDIRYAALAFDPLILILATQGRFNFYHETKAQLVNLVGELRYQFQSLRGYTDKSRKKLKEIENHLADITRNIEKMTDPEAERLMRLLNQAIALDKQNPNSESQALKTFLTPRDSANYRVLPSERSTLYNAMRFLLMLAGGGAAIYGGGQLFYTLGVQSATLFGTNSAILGGILGTFNSGFLTAIYAHKTPASVIRIADTAGDYLLGLINKAAQCFKASNTQGQTTTQANPDVIPDSWGSSVLNTLRNIVTWTLGAAATTPRLQLILLNAALRNNMLLIICSVGSVLASESWAMNEAVRSHVRNQLLKVARLLKEQLPHLSNDDEITRLHDLIGEAKSLAHQTILPITKKASVELQDDNVRSEDRKQPGYKNQLLVTHR